MLKALVRIIVFLMMVCVQDGLSDDGFFGGKITVRVYNGMNDSIPMYLHCRSKDDDLGQHVLAAGEHQEWSFKDRFFGFTLFWCTMDASNVHESFEIYNAKTELKKCDGLSDDAFYGGTTHVRVYNGMNDSIPVHLHCRSKDDDLGQHVLAVGEHQE
ncbi:S-protein-like 2 [Glycine soja]|uniref:S-protein homolog n=1 Tax=Glycine soja TaxID=3848 RepID=A0A445M3A5_GLYSO|nr:S-protein-like 2 [Glycine soja]